MTNYLENIDLLKQLEPIMDRLGVEADYCIGYANPGEIICDTDPPIYPRKIKTYRSDTLENVLPDLNKFFDHTKYNLFYISKLITERERVLIMQYGQPKLEALAQLVILLDGEGLLEEKE
jgi:hypothetical protein